MKTLLTITLLFVCIASGQTKMYSLDTIDFRLQKKNTKFIPLQATNQRGYSIITIDTIPRITIRSESKKYLTIDFGGDTVKTSGTLQLDSAATLFWEYCLERFISSRTTLQGRSRPQ